MCCRKDWKIKSYKGLPELFLELENERIDAIVIDSIPGLLAIKKTGKPIKKMDLPQIHTGLRRIEPECCNYEK
jgi:polar amino acid transport system substrate-binding protein